MPVGTHFERWAQNRPGGLTVPPVSEVRRCATRYLRRKVFHPVGWDENSGSVFLSSRPCCRSYSESAILEGGYRMENREPVKRVCSVFKSGESTTSKAQFTQKWIELINRMERNKAATPAQQ